MIKFVVEEKQLVDTVEGQLKIDVARHSTEEPRLYIFLQEVTAGENDDGRA